MGQCGCLDREKDKQRILQQLTSTAPMPQKSLHHHSLSTNSHNRRNSYQFSSKAGQQYSDTLSYFHKNQNNQFILINRTELQQFIRTNHQRIEQIIFNPLNQQQCIISFDQNDQTDPIIKESMIREQSFNKLYMAIKDFISSQEKKIIAILPEQQIYSVRIYYRELTQRQAINNAIEMQMTESINQNNLEEIVNERILDNLSCSNILQINGQNILIFQTSKRSIQALNVIQLDLTTLNAINLSQEIAAKVEILQNNDVYISNIIRNLNSLVYYLNPELNPFTY